MDLAFPAAACSVRRPRLGNTSGQGYRHKAVIHTHGPPRRRRRRFGLRDRKRMSGSASPPAALADLDALPER